MMKTKVLDKGLLDDLFKQAADNPKLRQNYDMRTSSNDSSQRMLNVLLPGTEVPIHRHPNSSENVICLSGQLDLVLYEELKEAVPVLGGFEQGMDAQDISFRTVLREKERIHLCPSEGNYGCIVPEGAWHTVEVFVPSVIYEAKDGKYGEDGSAFCVYPIAESSSSASSASSFHNSLGDLKKNIEYLIGKERADGNMQELSAEYISKVLKVDADEVMEVMKEIKLK